MRYLILRILALSSCLLLFACLESSDKDAAPAVSCDAGEDCFVRNEALNVTNNSRVDSQVSHNFGQNCMGCHQENGPGKGLFTIAGTIFGPELSTFNGGGTIRLFTDRPRTVEVYQFPIDKLGNFYSTDKLDVPEQGLYVSVFNAAGVKIKDMGSPKISFACNVCHAGLSSVIVKP